MGWLRNVLFFLLVLSLCGCLTGKSAKEAREQPSVEKDGQKAALEEAPQTSLLAPNGTESVAARPAEEPSPPEISHAEAVRQVSRLYPGGWQPLVIRGRLPILLHDLDRDQNPECFSIGIPTQGIDPGEARRLDDSSRLFQGGKNPLSFSLFIFGNEQGNFRRLKSLPLGEHLVFESLNKMNLYSGKTLPVIITVAFQTLEGRDVELLVFDNASGIPRSRRTLVESLYTQSRLEDIDGNGTIDLFVKERALEEGTGFETFLVWYRWNGRDFVEYQTQNIVRNLNSFLLAAAERMLSGEPAGMLAFLLDPGEVRTQRKRGLKDVQILVRALGLEELGLSALPPLREVVFPQILEDPFTAENERGSYFTIAYRLIDTEGTSYIARSRLYMMPNPFRDRQFAFASPVD